MKARGRTSRAPVAESFGQWKNLKVAILALLGLTAGQAVVWYTGQFYALFFLTQQLKVDATLAQLMLAAALLIGTPFSLCSARCPTGWDASPSSCWAALWRR